MSKFKRRPYPIITPIILSATLAMMRDKIF